jgi:hypothetical protein
MQPKKSFVRLLMPNKDFRKYNKGASSLPMKVEGEAHWFLFFAHFFAVLKNIEEFFSKIYIFLREGGNFENSYRKRNLKKYIYPT